MKQHHPLLPVFIFRKAAEKNLCDKELCIRAGYKNTNKGCNRLESFRRSGVIESGLLRSLIAILDIDLMELNRVLFDERTMQAEKLLADWKARIQPPDARADICNHCAFCAIDGHPECEHPLREAAVGRLHRSYPGVYDRPDWCPIPRIKPEPWEYPGNEENWFRI